MFGVGPYSFSSWKVAISGLYKSLEFRLVGPLAGKPVVLDDTCYLLPCEGPAQACLYHALLRTEEATRHLEAHIFWDEKRPVTREVLERLDLGKLAAVVEGRLLEVIALSGYAPEFKAALRLELEKLAASAAGLEPG